MLKETALKGRLKATLKIIQYRQMIAGGYFEHQFAK